jgi:hypothetical protein
MVSIGKLISFPPGLFGTIITILKSEAKNVDWS